MNPRLLPVSLALLGAIQFTDIRCLQASTIDESMRKVADKVSSWLTEEGHTKLSVGQFQAPPQYASAGGAGLKQVLVKHLEEKGVAVSRRSEIGLQGTYLAEEQLSRPTARVDVKLVDAQGKELFSMSQTITHEKELADTFGLTFESPAADTLKQRAQTLKRALEHPTAHVGETQTQVKPTPGSPYALEILVQSPALGHATPQPISLEDGLPFVKIDRGKTYQLKVTNHSSYDAAVTATIDGVSAFAFSDEKSYRHFIVPAHSSGVIKGWHRTNSASDSFLVDEYSKSAAAELLKSSSDLGQITVTFAAAWPQGAPAPKDEGMATYGRRGGGNATARGPSVATHYKPVARTVGRVRAAITVRYAKPPGNGAY